jgi:hypothetical protein
MTLLVSPVSQETKSVGLHTKEIDLLRSWKISFLYRIVANVMRQISDTTWEALIPHDSLANKQMLSSPNM